MWVIGITRARGDGPSITNNGPATGYLGIGVRTNVAIEFSEPLRF